MALQLWDPFTALARFDTDFDRLVRRSWGQVRTAGFVPAADVTTDGDDVLVTLELPGVDVEKDVEVEVADGRLTISGQRQQQDEQTSEDGRKVLVREFRYGSFRRDFALPKGVTAEQVSADYDQGLLTVRVSGVARPKPQPQKVAIRSGKQELPSAE
ncbi:Hsp20/alpha crystallin family protein [Fodinicola acaciae]|uniref:Hsp20/alpha crystallin family protein n=1 Tax=Fodinicola acaciae TaxID=2681555 RepID=UPI00165294CB|nr:Hsp20/alpha crystallin family protein [Fodinicola acaciae]